jgi:hypothetical protein
MLARLLSIKARHTIERDVDCIGLLNLILPLRSTIIVKLSETSKLHSKLVRVDQTGMIQQQCRSDAYYYSYEPLHPDPYHLASCIGPLFKVKYEPTC